MTEVLTHGIQHSLGKVRVKPGQVKEIQGLDQIDKLIEIGQDQSDEPHEAIRQPTPVYSMIFVICTRRPKKPECLVLQNQDSLSM